MLKLQNKFSGQQYTEYMLWYEYIPQQTAYNFCFTFHGSVVANSSHSTVFMDFCIHSQYKLHRGRRSCVYLLAHEHWSYNSPKQSHKDGALATICLHLILLLKFSSNAGHHDQADGLPSFVLSAPAGSESSLLSNTGYLGHQTSPTQSRWWASIVWMWMIAHNHPPTQAPSCRVQFSASFGPLLVDHEQQKLSEHFAMNRHQPKFLM